MPSDHDLDALQTHDWPGNVRELRRVLERALHSARGRPPRGEDLCAAIEIVGPARRGEGATARTLRESIQEAERRCYEQVLARTNGDWRAAVKPLEVSKSTFYRKLEAPGLRASPRPRPRRQT